MSEVFQIILLISAPLFVLKKWLGYVNRFKLKNRKIVLPLLSSGENPETFQVIRNQIEKNFELKQSIRFQYSTAVACLVSGSWALVVANLFHGFLEGFWTLLLIGGALSFAYYLYDTLEVELDLIDARFDPEKESAEKIQLEKTIDRKNSWKSFKIAIIVVLLVSGNWGFQNYKNDQNDRMAAIEELNGETGSGWCKNNEASSDGAGGYYTYGGWPCFTIGRISSISFKRDTNDYEICTSVYFNRESGLPERSQYDLDFEYKSFCAEKSYGSYDVYDLKSQMYEYISPKLDQLQKDLCRLYAGQLYYEDFDKFCYLS